MRLLLDTHTFLWAISAPHKLPSKARAAIEDRTHEAYVSAVSLWEIAIKVRLKKLHLGWDEDVIDAAVKGGFVPIPLTPEEAATSVNLTEDTHFDPFDRMLIWQAISRKLVLVSKDATFRRFAADGLKLLWDQ